MDAISICKFRLAGRVDSSALRWRGCHLSWEECSTDDGNSEGVQLDAMNASIVAAF